VKPAPFDFVAPRSVAEVLAELEHDADDTKVIAGGQSLIPMLALRLARPARLVDINGPSGLNTVTSDGATITIGSTTRHVQLQRNELPGPIGHLLRVAASQIGHHPIRTRGTFGGSIAHCDPAAEWCLVAALLDAQITVASAARGQRTIVASKFFESLFTTTLEPDELLLKVDLPALDGAWVTGLAEFARRAGDFGIVTVATALRVADGVVTDARIAIGGVADVPFRSRAAEAELTGSAWTAGTLRSAAERASEEVDPPSDAHGSAEHRRGLVRALLPRSAQQMMAAT
jgi:aerobic carbon-monoxide dehydrogenase medium subunit